MSDPWFKFFTSDWLTGVALLSDNERGVYMTLLALMYDGGGPIERKDERLARVCGCKRKSDFVKALNVLIEDGKIIDRDGFLSNERAENELKNREEMSQKQSEKAHKRWSGSSEKIQQNQQKPDAAASERHMPDECLSEARSQREKEEPNGSSKKNGSRLPENWQLPKEWGEWAVEQGVPPDTVRFEADRFRDYWIGKTGANAVKKSWLATWRNWIRTWLEKNRPKQQPQSDFWAGEKAYQ